MFFWTKPNINKCEIVGSKILKEAHEEVCGLQNIDSTNDTIKVVEIHFSYDKKITHMWRGEAQFRISF